MIAQDDDSPVSPDLLLEILDTLPLAIFLVDAEMRLQRINQAALLRLGLEGDAVLQQHTGNALRCVNAVQAPDGCGTAEACKTCVVRNSAAEALSTGRRVQESTRFVRVTDEGEKELSVVVTAARIAYQGRPLVVLTLEDVTELLQLRGLLPRCAWCGKIRDDDDYWQSVEEYLSMHHRMEITHAICEDCAEKVIAEPVDRSGDRH